MLALKYVYSGGIERKFKFLTIEMEREKVTQARKEVKRLYRTLFPLAIFDYNFVKAIRDIVQEIINLCLRKEITILFMLAGLLEIDQNLLNVKMDPVKLCELLLNKVSDLGLSLSQYEKTLLILPIKNVDLLKLICTQIGSDYPVKATYNDYGSFLYEFKKAFLDANYLDEANRFYYTGPMGPLPSIQEESNRQYDDLIRKYINFDVNTKDLIQILNNGNYRYGRIYTWQEADFIVRLHNGFRSGKIPLNITKDELCSNIHKYL